MGTGLSQSFLLRNINSNIQNILVINNEDNKGTFIHSLIGTKNPIILNNFKFLAVLTSFITTYYIIHINQLYFLMKFNIKPYKVCNLFYSCSF